MAAPANVQDNGTFALIESPIVTVGTTIDLEGIDAVKPHVFAAVQFFADALGATPATPGAGTVTITVETVNNTPILESPPEAVIDATDLTTVDWGANTKRVIATPAGITVATHYRLIVTCNET